MYRLGPERTPKDGVNTTIGIGWSTAAGETTEVRGCSNVKTTKSVMALVRCSRRESLGQFWNGLNGSIIVARMKGATEADQVLSPHVCARS